MTKAKTNNTHYIRAKESISLPLHYLSQLCCLNSTEKAAFSQVNATSSVVYVCSKIETNKTRYRKWKTAGALLVPSPIMPASRDIPQGLICQNTCMLSEVVRFTCLHMRIRIFCDLEPLRALRLVSKNLIYHDL